MMALTKCACMHNIACNGCNSLSCNHSFTGTSQLNDCGSSSRTMEQQMQRLRQRQQLLQQQQQQQSTELMSQKVGTERGCRQSMINITSVEPEGLTRRNSQPLNGIDCNGSVSRSPSYPLQIEGGGPQQASPTRSPCSSSPCSSIGSSLTGSSGPQTLSGRLTTGPRSRQNTPDGGTLMSLVTRWRSDRSSRSGGEASSPRSEAGSPSLSAHSSNSRESLNCEHLMIGEAALGLAICVRIYVEDDRYYSVKIDRSTTVAELLDYIIEKSQAKHDPSWTIVEFIRKNHLERTVEEHEVIYSVQSSWGEQSGNRFYLRTDYNKYELFKNPNQYLPESMTDVELPKEDCSGLLTRYERYKNILLQNLLGNDSIPNVHGYMHMREGKRSWKKYFCVLTTSGLYYATKGVCKDPNFMTLACRLDNVNIYKAQHAKKYMNAPTNYGICLRVMGADDSDKSYNTSKMFCCENEQSRLCWVTALRFIKFGAQLRENFKLMLKCEERLKTLETQMNGLLSDHGLCSVDPIQTVQPQPAVNGHSVVNNHNNISSHPATDRHSTYIAAEQLDASLPRYDILPAAITPINGTVRSNGMATLISRASCVFPPTPQINPTSPITPPPSNSLYQNVPPPAPRVITPPPGLPSPTGLPLPPKRPPSPNSKPWFHSGLTREQAESLVKQHGISEGVFLIRDSQSMPGLIVLSFLHQAQVKHCKILKEVDAEGKSYFTLDGGVTRFSELQQLVDFYRMNSGALPTRLSQYVTNNL